MSALQFIAKLRTETLAPDDWRGKPLCMNQYRKLFGCTRVPQEGRHLSLPTGVRSRPVTSTG